MNKSKLKQNTYFRDLTTFKVGGPIKYFAEVKNDQEVVEAVSFAKQENLQIFVAGGGSDVLVSDKPFDGLVIKYVGDSLKIDKNVLTAEAGVLWDDVVEFAVKNNLQGIECLSGIPGNTGAAPIQNIGAYGQELKNVFLSLKAYDITSEMFVNFSNDECKFGYRESIFKTNEYWQKYVITEITLKLEKDNEPLVKYDSLKNYLSEKNIVKPGLSEVREAVKFIRSGKFEDPKKVGNAGSFFKNPIIDKHKAEQLMSDYAEIKCREQDDGTYKCFAAWFIENAGWKGGRYKTAGVSPKHALVLINPDGNASAGDVLELSEKIIKDVEDKFGVRLEREVQLINF